MLPLLEDYAKQLQKDEDHAKLQNTIGRQSYYMPPDSVSPEEWSEFSNVYQVHCPQVFMDNIIRDVSPQQVFTTHLSLINVIVDIITILLLFSRSTGDGVSYGQSVSTLPPKFPWFHGVDCSSVLLSSSATRHK